MATIRLMIWSRSDVNNVWIKSGGGGKKKKRKRKEMEKEGVLSGA